MPRSRDYRITLVIGPDYLADLDRRLQAYRITRSELAKEWGKNRSHVSRMFNTGSQPKLESIREIELAIARIRVRQDAALRGITHTEVNERLAAARQAVEGITDTEVEEDG